ncbi:MAG TPA: hypothetical protein PLR99_29035, partial [Polyangiaceae bacterium]|nr:hypothetical protein [Polyangiaceae bacterium]
MDRSPATPAAVRRAVRRAAAASLAAVALGLLRRPVAARAGARVLGLGQRFRLLGQCARAF